MSDITVGILAAGIAYLVGSIPFGFLIAKWVRRIDIREFGSGNIGATNVGRVMGARWGISVLLLDLLKGMLPVLLPAVLLVGGRDNPNIVHVRVFAGIAAITGHMFPCFLKFRGGKGVATALGVVLVLSLAIGKLPISVAVGVYVVSFAIRRIASVSSMLAAASFAAGMFIATEHPFSHENWSLTVFCLAIPAAIFYRHRSNIGRLWRGEEQQFHFEAHSEQRVKDR